MHARSKWSTAVETRDETCRVTNDHAPLETAHLIPNSEAEWFDLQDMARYSVDPDNLAYVSNSANLLRLRQDLHTLFDAFTWVIVPKGSQWVFHLLGKPTNLGPRYHNARLHPLRGIGVEYLLAAFARAIFPKIGRWLRNGAEKVLCVDTGIGTEIDAASQVFSGGWCREKFPFSEDKGRSPSPKKRKAEGNDTRDNDCTTGPSDSPADKKVKLTSSAVSRNRISDRPCICPPLPASPPTTPPLSASLDESLPDMLPRGCYSRRCIVRADMRRLGEVRQDALRLERMHSGMQEWWASQTEWLQGPWARSTNAEHRKRFLWTQGEEVRDDDGEWVDTKEEFVQGFEDWD